MDIRLTTTNQNFKIEKYTENDREQILNVWEKSVLATHDFLSPTDFEEIKQLVHTFNFNDFEVYCLKQNEEVAGFIGLAERKIEMLFFSPEYIGKGLGRKLTDFAFSELKADKVDVNEQNTSAVKFYEKLGFKTYERTDKDDQGKEYPLLRMKLETMEN
ncbi:GNAT family N-acetyltransferase [Arcicella sp. DC2W]|uniref:GNAT family N-acetyltransferase n=1 Tax=Arcicella gelida TaxID=2984195 RepID=A0ABU5SC42_9BACT|nr:GNAT family N-acetyltransferase [Arcicella sp. DC2W]MEA5406062.1 GNAT family N-acetyltransferase [Arcicella sp. DC2W]